MSKKNTTKIGNVGKFPTLETLAAKLDMVLAGIAAAPLTDAGNELVERLNSRKWKILEKIDETHAKNVAEFAVKAAVFSKQRELEGHESGYYGPGTAESLSKSLIEDALLIMGGGEMNTRFLLIARQASPTGLSRTTRRKNSYR